MWSLIAGKLMCFWIQFLLIKLFKDFCFSNFSVIEKSVCWFLIEHVFEQYSLTSGKFFMVNEDFRRLITNFLKIVRDLVYWAHIITITEVFTFVFTIYYLFYLGFVNFYCKLTKQNWTIKDLGYYLFTCILMIKIYVRYTKFDVFFVLRPLVILFDCVCFFSYFYLICFVLYHYLFWRSFASFKQVRFKYLIIRSSLYLISFLVNFYFIYFILFFENDTSNNFFQEFTLKILFFYIYFYYH